MRTRTIHKTATWMILWRTAKRSFEECPRAMKIPGIAIAVLVLALGLSCLTQPSLAAGDTFCNFSTIVAPLMLGVVAAAGFAVWNRRPYEKRIVQISLAYVAAAVMLVWLRAHVMQEDIAPVTMEALPGGTGRDASPRRPRTAEDSRPYHVTRNLGLVEDETTLESR